MIHLREITLNITSRNQQLYPFSLLLIQNLERMPFPSTVTIFIGENGSGKSTLLAGIAKASEIIRVGSEDFIQEPDDKASSELADAMRLVWNKRIHKGFFLRAEDFFRFTENLQMLRQNFQAEINRVDRDYQDRSDYSKKLAKGPAVSSMRALDERYGTSPGAKSHGERFLNLFQSRFVPGGLYLLDEPEAALSPISQLGLISMIKEMLQQDAQFIIATHSPILMACPQGTIYDFDQHPPVTREYETIEHVRLYRSFLTDPEAFLHHL